MTLPAAWAWATPLKALASLLFLGHMAATCVQALPAESAIRPLSVPFRHYEEVVGLWQTWDMFTTIPYFHDYHVDLQVTGADGRVTQEGVLLPGLRGFDRAVRTETLFMRLLYDPEFAPYLHGYIDNVCHELRAKRANGGQKVVVHESCQRMRFLNQIREDGKIANPEEHSSQVFTCGD
jgi:hypothetical protein